MIPSSVKSRQKSGFHIIHPESSPLVSIYVSMWDTERVRFGVVRNGVPVLETAVTGAEIQPLARFWQHAGPIRDRAGLVDVEQVLIAGVVRRHESARLAVNLPENPELANLEQRPPTVVIDQQIL